MTKMKLISGYRGIAENRGQYVPADQALARVLAECGAEITNLSAPLAEEFQQMAVDWYFSGSWVAAYEGDDHG